MTATPRAARMPPVSARSADWEFVLTLPNLRLAADRDMNDELEWPQGIDLRSGLVRLVGGEDAVVRTLRSQDASVEHILSSFRDEYGSAFIPAVLLVRNDAPATLKTSAAAFNDFRNAVAVMMIL